MPLLWKKAGISRISRLMADLHPTKPCSSMLLQTGFPTSLVDLFVKNCDRLKKPINKRKKKKNKHHHRNHQDFSVSDPVDSSGSEEKEKDHPVNLNNCLFKTNVNFDCQKKSIGRFESESDEEGLNIRGGGFDNSGCNNRDQRGVLYAVFIVFVLVILALISIKILTLGITMSACFLIFLEYIGKQIFRCYVCNFVRFKSAFWVFLCKREEEVIIESKVEEEQEDEQEEEEEEEDSIESNSTVEEIEARFDAVARVEPDSDGTRMNLSPGRWGYSDIEVEEEEDDCFEVTAPEKQHSRGRRRRSSKEFMKKLVPKKWRSTKKAAKAQKGKEITEEYASSSEFSSSHSSEDKLARNEEIEELYNNNSESNKGRRITFMIEEESKMSSENSVESEKSYNEEEAVIKNERKSEKGSAFLLLVVALAGLVGGRIIALVLTVISCVIIQLVTNRRAQCSKAMC